MLIPACFIFPNKDFKNKGLIGDYQNYTMQVPTQLNTRTSGWCAVQVFWVLLLLPIELSGSWDTTGLAILSTQE